MLGGRPSRDMTHEEAMAEIGHEWGAEWRARAEDVSFPELLETLAACALAGVMIPATRRKARTGVREWAQGGLRAQGYQYVPKLRTGVGDPRHPRSSHIQGSG